MRVNIKHFSGVVRISKNEVLSLIESHTHNHCCHKDGTIIIKCFSVIIAIILISIKLTAEV